MKKLNKHQKRYLWNHKASSKSNIAIHQMVVRAVESHDIVYANAVKCY